ncbi:unnamed protein product (macronuclear) [Paramecium tetraurelia]|uniref:Uncharacterized protein n=1 Tax=Paramecium tetraurelia TaxID=5888 RepID=A0E5P3_PARTE|nr:uncharacterized protein GSPATT00003472001 [Paramecium tetraurelia]CAK90610.1 unnamed protein product [Paramecium tetraurelia]|eukprot:XP_001458007.1 hypothetical protein (macronuclear) [Paramecium tetraurelia strain d4-2]
MSEHITLYKIDVLCFLGHFNKQDFLRSICCTHSQFGLNFHCVIRDKKTPEICKNFSKGRQANNRKKVGGSKLVFICQWKQQIDGEQPVNWNFYKKRNADTIKDWHMFFQLKILTPIFRDEGQDQMVRCYLEKQFKIILVPFAFAQGRQVIIQSLQ